MAFDGDVVLVTGGSLGIGRAAALEFAAAGATVAIQYRQSSSAAEEVLATIGPGPHIALQADVADPAQVQGLVRSVVDRLGRVDVLVNNAGVYTRHPVLDTDYATWQEAWRETIDTNLIGPANLVHCVVPHMIAAGGGRIVNVTSRGAFRGEPEHPAYGASKAGLNALGQSMAIALAGDGIAVSTVAQGYVETDMSNADLKEPRGAEIRAQSPFNWVARSEEVAAAVLYLASTAAEWASGAVLDLNGASYLR
jgi:3-oxoacyl-[acyl-carrier protein] reductase